MQPEQPSTQNLDRRAVNGDPYEPMQPEQREGEALVSDATRRVFASKHECSPTASKLGRELIDALAASQERERLSTAKRIERQARENEGQLCPTCGAKGWLTSAEARLWVASQERLAEAKRVEEYVERVRAIARECGYAVGVHGTLKRDLDLIAAPWTIEAVSAQDLVDAICEGMGLRPKYVNDYPDGRVMSNPEAKPWGRIGWSLIGPLPKPCKYVDLSVAPRTGESFPIQFAALDSTQTHGGPDA